MFDTNMLDTFMTQARRAVAMTEQRLR